MTDLHTADLEAKVQTYEHIDKIREMLRLFAVELLTRGETHDRSKLKPAESKVFAEFTPKLRGTTYGSDEYKSFLRDMKPALDHHYANNRHHPEHHEGGIDGMNLLDVLEMWIDWYCSSMRHADGDMGRSIDINEKRFSMSPQLTTIFRNTLRDLKLGTLSRNRGDGPPPPPPILGETSRPQRYALCIDCGYTKTPAESMGCVSCHGRNMTEPPLEMAPDEPVAWDVLDRAAEKVLGTVWAHTKKGAQFSAEEHFSAGQLDVRIAKTQRRQPMPDQD